MIYEVTGDILLSKAQAVAHGVAPNDHFTQGLALSLRERYPAMAKDFRHYCQSTHPKSGEVWAWAGADGRRVVNLMTQQGEYGHHGAKHGKAELEFVHRALKGLRKFVEAEKITSLALPKIATGVGGLPWSEVYPMVKDALGDLKIPVYVYTTFHAGQQANEPGI